MTDPAPGATPAAGATPTDAGKPPEAPTPPAAPVAPPAPAASAAPATGEPDGLGDAGKRALDAMKGERNAATERAKAAEQELADLKAAGQTDHEKALAKAVKDAESKKDAEHESWIREQKVESALRAKGFANEKALDRVVKFPEFAALKVEADRSIPDLGKAVDQFAKDYSEWFPAKGGTVTRGPSGDGSQDQPASLDGALAAHYGATRP